MMVVQFKMNWASNLVIGGAEPINYRPRGYLGVRTFGEQGRCTVTVARALSKRLHVQCPGSLPVGGDVGRIHTSHRTTAEHTAVEYN
jgi:hypothetical protein